MKDALKNGASTRDLVGMKLEEFWNNFHYDTEKGKLSCTSKECLAEYEANKNAEHERLKGLTLEEFRDELIEKYREKVEKYEAGIAENEILLQCAREKSTELEKLDIGNEAVNFAVKDLLCTLRVVEDDAKSKITCMEIDLERAKFQLKNLTKWSNDTRAWAEDALESLIEDAKIAARGKSSFASRMRMEMRAVEIFDDIFGNKGLEDDKEDHDR